MGTIDKIFVLIDVIFFFIERSDLSREERDELNREVRERFDALPHPSTLKDTVEK